MTQDLPYLRIGMIGCDTSHATEFSARLNDPSHPGHVTGARVVAALPAASEDMVWSSSRIDGFVMELRETLGVRIVASMEELLADCDAVLLCSLDGRAHPAQAAPVLDARKPIFVDKPVAASLRDVISLYQRAGACGTPMFSASALRWFPGVVAVAAEDVGTVRGAFSYGPAPLEKSHPDLFFYGIHPTEALFTVLGAGCLGVQRVSTPHTSVIVGEWSDGRVGTLHAMHQWPADYKVIKFGTERIAEQTSGGDYTPMLREIVTFFHTGVPPVAPGETLEIYAFMEAADESRRRGGAFVALAEVMEQSLGSSITPVPPASS
ncbi:MAG: Gfo/Idh/MocA family protein [Roseimicrobium sp.]